MQHCAVQHWTVQCCASMNVSQISPFVFPHLPEKNALHRLIQLIEYGATGLEVMGSNPGLTNTQGLQITKYKVLPLYVHLQVVKRSSLLG